MMLFWFRDKSYLVVFNSLPAGKGRIVFVFIPFPVVLYHQHRPAEVSPTVG